MREVDAAAKVNCLLVSWIEKSLSIIDRLGLWRKKSEGCEDCLIEFSFDFVSSTYIKDNADVTTPGAFRTVKVFLRKWLATNRIGLWERLPAGSERHTPSWNDDSVPHRRASK